MESLTFEFKINKLNENLYFFNEILTDKFKNNFSRLLKLKKKLNLTNYLNFKSII